MTTLKYRVTPITDPNALCSPDYSAAPIRPCEPYLELDTRDGTLYIGTQHQCENMIPFSVRYGICRRYDIPYDIDAERLTTAINNGEFDELFERIYVGTDYEWDGNNYVAELSDDARNAEDELQDLIDEIAAAGISAALWAAGDWLAAIDVAAEFGITVDTTDAELKAIATRIEDEAAQERVVVYDTEEYLQDVRQNLQYDEECEDD